MFAYVVRRVLLLLVTVPAVLALTFVIVQFAPGGPVEHIIAQVRQHGGGGEAGAVISVGAAPQAGVYKGAQELDAELVRDLRRQFGFDRPAHERFFSMLQRYLRFDFGVSYFKGRPVAELMVEKLPVSLALGLCSTLPMYLLAVPLGIRKAVRQGSRFDSLSSLVATALYALPAFLLAVVLLTLFAGGSYWHVLPLRGLTGENFSQLSFFGKIRDLLWHLTLPVLALTAGGLARLMSMTKNTFADELHKPYTLTARAKGASPRRVLYGHVFRNASLTLVADLPLVLAGTLLTGNVLIETLFSLDGLGLLAYEATMQRDYAVVFAVLYVFTLTGLAAKLLSDLLYAVIDPRIDFSGVG